MRIINLNDILHVESKLRFLFNKTHDYKNDHRIYLIKFAGIVSEAYSNDVNKYCSKVEYYPKKDPEDATTYYSANILMGKEYVLKFALNNSQIWEGDFEYDEEEIEEEKKESEKEEEEEEYEECPRNTPIMKNGECVSTYCTPSEFESGKCRIANTKIKRQWLNTFHIFDEDASYISVITTEKNDVYLLAQKDIDNYSQKYIYGFNSEGNPKFYNSKKSKFVSFLTFDYPDIDFSDKLQHIEIDYQGYIITNMIKKTNYIIEYNKEKDIIDISQIKDNSDIVEEYYTDTIFKLKNTNNEYFTDFIFCKNNYLPANCSISFRKYTINNKSDINLSYEKRQISIDPHGQLICYQNSGNYIQCIYTITVLNRTTEITKSLHILGIFDPNTF